MLHRKANKNWWYVALILGVSADGKQTPGQPEREQCTVDNSSIEKRGWDVLSYHTGASPAAKMQTCSSSE
jgi:hypothetical protein